MNTFQKNFFYFFLMQYNDYLIKIEIRFVHFYSCLSYFCFLPDLKIKVFIIFNLQCIYYIFHHLLFDRLKHLTKYFISPSHASIFFQKIGISFFQKNVVYVNLFFQQKFPLSCAFWCTFRNPVPYLNVFSLQCLSYFCVSLFYSSTQLALFCPYP